MRSAEQLAEPKKTRLEMIQTSHKKLYKEKLDRLIKLIKTGQRQDKVEGTKKNNLKNRKRNLSESPPTKANKKDKEPEDSNDLYSHH